MKDLTERLRAAGVHTLLAQFTDLNGVAKGKWLPLAHLDDLLSDGVAFSGASIAGTGLPRTGPRSQYIARGYASTVTRAAVAARRGACGLRRFCQRPALRRLPAPGAQARAGAAGRSRLAPAHRHRARILPAAPDGQPPCGRRRSTTGSNNPPTTCSPLSRQHDFLQALVAALGAGGIDVGQIDHGEARGQYEVNFGFDEALVSADHLMLFKAGRRMRWPNNAAWCFRCCPSPSSNNPAAACTCTLSLWSGWNAKRRDNAQCVFVAHRADGSVDREREPGAARRALRRRRAGPCGRADRAGPRPTIDSYRRLRCRALHVRQQLGAGVDRTRSEQPHRRHPHPARALRMARQRRQRQPLPGQRGAGGGRAWTASTASSKRRPSAATTCST